MNVFSKNNVRLGVVYHENITRRDRLQTRAGAHKHTSTPTNKQRYYFFCIAPLLLTFARPRCAHASFSSGSFNDWICDLVGTHGNHAGKTDGRNGELLLEEDEGAN